MAIDESRLPSLVVVGLVFAASLLAMWVRSTRHRSLLGWLAGMFLGLFFLLSGVEFLAIVFWLCSTFTVVVERLFLVGFSNRKETLSLRRRLGGLVLPFGMIGLAFSLPQNTGGSQSAEWKGGLVEIGSELVESHGLTFVVAFMLALIVSVGVGVIAVSVFPNGRRGKAS